MRFLAGIVKSGLFISLTLPTVVIYAQDPGNGIHVGDAKVYDARELTLMLDSLNRALQGKNFIDQNKLAAALGNVQGFQGTDTSTGVFANGAVGPQAASVFAGNLSASSSSSAAASAAAPAASTSAPAVSININPAASSAPSSTSTSPTGFGPSSPALPTLQTAPTYNPSYGPSGNDLLTDEVSLSYQIVNLSMLLNRSLTDQTFEDRPRLQAVVGFDIDIEPDDKAKDAVAVVEISASMEECPVVPASEHPAPDYKPPLCQRGVKPEIVAMMPEQGSHNAATLTQSANSFGGALAAQVFSVGVVGQKRSQTFYLYRDIDTVSFQEPDKNFPKELHFGWQFRPVLGRRTVEAGLRHMMVVLSLPASDEETGAPSLRIQVKTHWVRYESKTQTTTVHENFFQNLFSHFPEREDGWYDQQTPLLVPRTEEYQKELAPVVDRVQWVLTDNANGVAIITGHNFFLGTTVRVGNKTYTGNNDGLTLKSDKEMELAVPLSAAVGGGIVSGRYGNALPLENHDWAQYSAGFEWEGVDVYPEGPDAAQVVARILVYPPSIKGQPTISCEPGPEGSYPVDQNGNPIPLDEKKVPLNLASLPKVDMAKFEEHINHPGLFLNGSPIAAATWFIWNPIGSFKTCKNGFPPGSNLLNVDAIVPAKDVLKGSPVITVAFPFEGADWSQSGIYFDSALNLTRAGSADIAKLILASNNPGDLLCDGHWSVQLDKCEVYIWSGDPKIKACELWPKSEQDESVAKEKKHGEGKKSGAKKETVPFQPVLSCFDAVQRRKLGLDIAAGQIKNYKKLVLVHRENGLIDIARVGTIPDAKYKPLAPKVTKGPEPASIQQYSSQTIEVDGTDLDQIKTVLFDKTELKVVNQDAESLIISIPRSMTQKPATHDQIQLISDLNDPVFIYLDVIANPAALKK
jgi:hypothetical protein